MKLTEHSKGVIGVLATMFLWGILPVYWQALIPINSWVIILYRIVLVFVFSLLAARRSYSFRRIFEPLKDPATRRMYFLAGAFITVNWSTYIYGVNANQIVQCSLGYYIEPIVICIFGIVIFNEKITRYKLIAMVMAVCSIILLLVHFGEIPKLAILLAVSFAVYTAIKKKADQPPLISLVYETMIFVPPALAAVIYLESSDKGAFQVATSGQLVLLGLCGLVTMVPLALFAYAAKRCSMFELGLFEYSSPTIQLLVGITLGGESIDIVQIIGFVIIWVGLVFFTYGEFMESRKSIAEGE